MLQLRWPPVAGQVLRWLMVLVAGQVLVRVVLVVVGVDRDPTPSPALGPDSHLHDLGLGSGELVVLGCAVELLLVLLGRRHHPPLLARIAHRLTDGDTRGCGGPHLSPTHRLISLTQLWR